MHVEMKVCPKCGFMAPVRSSAHKCKRCGTPYPNESGGRCDYCGEWKDYVNNASRMCKQCSAIAVKKVLDRHRATAEDLYNIIVDKVALKKLPFRALRDEEWIRTCIHFDGCVMCGADRIDSKMYFIPFRKGGRYTPYNMLPICDKCSEYLYRSKYNEDPIGFFVRNRDKLPPIVSYLEGVLDNYVD